MARHIEDYALIGDLETAALVGRDGSIDWLCWPRFDSDACFTAILGTNKNGRWLLAPTDTGKVTRRYRPDTLILETRFETAAGRCLVIDFMPPRGQTSALIRIVIGERGSVRMRTELIVRFGLRCLRALGHARCERVHGARSRDRTWLRCDSVAIAGRGHGNRR